MLVELQTHSESGSGTDDHLYIGIFGTDGGREFPLDSPSDDFEAGSHITYVLGETPASQPDWRRPNFSEPGGRCDPAGLGIDLDSVQQVYIRKQARGFTTSDDDAYQLDLVRVILQAGNESRAFILPTTGAKGLWLGNEFGHQAWLRVLGVNPPA
ncbi:PLAT/LH2 domain-containing protein [Rhodococcus sp. T7]|uniref:PLAT/LH2 domain-containing protein n=1 Tax=Rhodococcus sp. T7 TaxID=627444 RepID=UPI0013589296|nr:PLAT/LH2 domain-containing protein [Rhodococcus sp. T7]